MNLFTLCNRNALVDDNDLHSSFFPTRQIQQTPRDVWVNSNLASWCTCSSDVIETEETQHIRQVQNFKKKLGQNYSYGLREEKKHSALQWQKRRLQEWISEGPAKSEQSWCRKWGLWGTLGVVTGVTQADRASPGWRLRCCPRLTMNCVTVEVAVVLWLNRDSLLYLVASQHLPHPLPPRQTSGQDHPPPCLAPVALHPLVPQTWLSSTAFPPLAPLPLTACETPGEARNSSSSTKAWDYVQNGSACSIQFSQLREGSYNTSRRTGGTAQALGSPLCLLKPLTCCPAPFRGLLSSHNTCQQLLSTVKDPGTENRTGQLGLVLFCLQNLVLVSNSSESLSQGNSCSPKEPL